MVFMQKKRTWKLLAMSAGLILQFACAGGNEFEENPVVESQSQSLVVSELERGVEKERVQRQQARVRFDQIKHKLGLLTEKENGTKEALLKELEIAMVQGKEPNVQGKKPFMNNQASEKIGTLPDSFLIAKYQKLREKMPRYNLNNPEDIAAWASLKRKELGK